MKTMLRHKIGIGLLILGHVVCMTIFAIGLTGCSLNEDLVVEQFCSYYPEVCQYIDFE
ncbi:hypothetical protein LCGC14_0722050 [marine sediment metagenome]|uniref:Uncharacterized protein n=1 Tax=marine sediment metagenome TaxID=412755 RepID=A0A0F9QG90_9ZZZZ